MLHVIPAVIPASAEALLAVSQELTFAPALQIDIVDGNFAQPASWPYEPAGTPDAVAAVCERYDVQVDIMAVDPAAMAEAWLQAGASELVIHLESIADVDPLKALRQQYMCKLFLAGADTLPVAEYVKHQADIDGVQLMGISTIGQQGQPLSARVHENITALKAAAPNLCIQVDGGVNQETIGTLLEAGATQFVAGSAIMQAADKRAAYHALREQLPS